VTREEMDAAIAASGSHKWLELVLAAADTGDRLIIAADIVARHRPILFSATHQVYVCGSCSNGHSRVTWPCALRADVGTLIDDPSNRLLPPHQETS